MIKNGVVAGRFRLLHTAHRELIIKAYTMCENLHIIINRDPAEEQYSTDKEKVIAIRTLINNIVGDGGGNTVHIYLTDNLEGEKWDKKVLELVPDVDYIFNSKENYDNTYIDNKYLELKSPNDLSASVIERDFINNRHLIMKEYLPFMNKRIIITGIESCGKTSLTKKLAAYYNTTFSDESGRYYSERYLAGDEELFVNKHFEEIVMSQILQDKARNLEANGLLFVDTDAIVTQYYQKLYGEEKASFSYDAGSIFQYAVDTHVSKADLVIYLKPNVDFVDDGFRWVNENEQRVKNDLFLLKMYEDYGIPVVVLENNSYHDTFYDAVELIDNMFTDIRQNKKELKQ